MGLQVVTWSRNGTVQVVKHNTNGNASSHLQYELDCKWSISARTGMRVADWNTNGLQVVTWNRNGTASSVLQYASSFLSWGAPSAKRNPHCSGMAHKPECGRTQTLVRNLLENSPGHFPSSPVLEVPESIVIRHCLRKRLFAVGNKPVLSVSRAQCMHFFLEGDMRCYWYFVVKTVVICRLYYTTTASITLSSLARPAHVMWWCIVINASGSRVTHDGKHYARLDTEGDDQTTYTVWIQLKARHGTTTSVMKKGKKCTNTFFLLSAPSHVWCCILGGRNTSAWPIFTLSCEFQYLHVRQHLNV